MASDPLDPLSVDPVPLDPRIVRLAELVLRVRDKAREGVAAARGALATIVAVGLLLIELVLMGGLTVGRWLMRLPSWRQVVVVGVIIGVPIAGAAQLAYLIEAGSKPGFAGGEPGTAVSAVTWSHVGHYAAVGTHDGRIIVWDHAKRRTVATLQAGGAVMALQLFGEPAPGRPPSLRLFARTVGSGGQVSGFPLQQQQQQQQQVPNISAGAALGARSARAEVLEWTVALDGAILRASRRSGDPDPSTGRHLGVVQSQSGGRGGNFSNAPAAPSDQGRDPGIFAVLDDILRPSMSAYAGAEGAGRVTAAMVADDGSTLAVLGLDTGDVLVEGVARAKYAALEVTGVPVTALAAGPSTRSFFSGTAGGNVARHEPDGKSTMQLYGGRPWTITPGAVLSGHAGPVVGDIAADGSRAVTASPDGVLQLWDLGASPPRAVLAPHRERVEHVALSADGSLLVTAHQDGSARVWSLRGDAGFARDLPGGRGAVLHVELSPDRNLVATASADGNVRVWDLRQASDPVLLQAGAQVNHVAFSPDSGLVVAACEDGTARVWQLGTSEVTVLEGHGRAVRRAIFSPDGAWILTVAAEGAARLWRVGGNIPTLLAIRGATFLDGAFSADSSQIALSSADGDVWLWRFRDRQTPILDPIGLKGPGRAAWTPSFGRNGQSLLVGYADGSARLWDLRGAAPRATILRGHGSAVTQAKLARDGLVILTASTDGTARLWAAQNSVSAHASAVIGLHVIGQKSPGDRTFFWSVSEDGEALLWRSDADAPLLAVSHGARVVASGIVDDMYLYTAGHDGLVRLWDVDLGQRCGTIAGHAAPLTHAAASADGRYLLSADADGVVRITHLAHAAGADVWHIARYLLTWMVTSIESEVRGAIVEWRGGSGQGSSGSAPPAPAGPAPTAR